jgi:hypothetical protein
VILGKKKFNVTFGKKCGHRHEHEIEGSHAININGSVGPILKLQRGYQYYFNVKQDKCDGHENLFVLTENPVGKINGHPPKPLKNSFDAVSKGCVSFYVDNCTPKYFYYQNSNAAFQGGLVWITDSC